MAVRETNNTSGVETGVAGLTISTQVIALHTNDDDVDDDRIANK